MIPLEILSALKAYALSGETLPLVRSDPGQSGSAGAQQPAFDVGQKLPATVLSEVSSGVFNVKVAGQVIQMKLPANVQVGDAVELQVMSLQPRLTFSLATSQSPPLSTSQQLSLMARQLAAFARQQPQSGRASAQATQRTPVMATEEPPQAQPLAQLLRQAVNNSGLFYESHQAQWIKGEITTAQLMTEPQNQSSLPASRGGAAIQPDPANVQPSSRGVVDGAASTLTAGTAVNPAATASPASAMSSAVDLSTGTLPVPPHLQALVQQQLSALETGRIFWEGQVFPQHWMQWNIWQEDGRGAGNGSSAGGQEGDTIHQWATEIHLELPSLGPVSAHMRIGPTGVQLSLEASQATTRDRLQQAAPSLVASMSAAGIPVTVAQVVSSHERS